MNVEYLLQLLNNRLSVLGAAKEQAFLTGDLERINTLDTEMNGVVDTINKLKLLEGISQTALVTPYTEAEIVQNGIEASFGVNKVFNSGSSDCLLGYDISSYATDPLHEEKIADILTYIDTMDSIEKIDAYIESEAIGSPVKGYMVFNSATKWNVDARLMLALMELDSRFGTVGLAIKTLNPGNVGNTDDGDTKTYASWDEGVEAVAVWLNNHRVEEVIEEEEEDDENEDDEVDTEDNSSVTEDSNTTENQVSRSSKRKSSVG